MNIIILMAGRGKRVGDFAAPKPMIKINDQYLVELSINSLKLPGKYIFITRTFQEYGEDYNALLSQVLNKIQPGCHIINIDFVTEGPACTALLAEDLINNDEELMIVNCDHILNWDHEKFLSHIRDTECDVCVTTYDHGGIVINEPSPYSFVKMDGDWAVEFQEKFAISYDALNGLHYWRHGSMFVESAKQMIDNNDRVNNEFYISKTFNYIMDKKINIFKMQKDEFIAMGTSEEIKRYLEGLSG